ncbi:hypothetical protein FYJ61_06310 [Lactobacillus equicursoris]|uniref:Transposase n=1 Tax=Lactobacillus equicursoris TaxID=420645 RepID=A0A844FN82_9LACO|nr:hypothetical protein [Lactobacillus equicursoris]MST80074.1 hypothetical protein [Lactobacillus equicursoris]
MAAECINYFVYHPSKDFTRKRKLDAKTFIKTTLAMQGNCLNKELADAFPKPSKRMTALAYEQQKSKVNPRLFKAILYEFNSTLKQPALYHGYRLHTTPMIGNSKQMIEEIEAYHHPVRKGRQYPRPLRFQGSVSLNYRIS